jgi:hypothetical protein
LALSISLQLDRRRSAARGLERAPTVAREARRADSRNPRRKIEKQSSSASPLSHLQLNDISISFT